MKVISLKDEKSLCYKKVIPKNRKIVSIFIFWLKELEIGI